MAFHFSLQSILRLRQSLEERERLRLAVIAAAISDLRLKCERLDQQSVEAANALCERLGNGLTAGEVQLVRMGMVSVRRQKEVLLQQMIALQKQRNQQEHAFREAERKRKVVERLRDLKLEAYRRDQERREQQRLDDQFGRRHASVGPSEAD